MTVWVLFLVFVEYHASGGGVGVASVSYEFKDKEQCVSAYSNFQKNIKVDNVEGFCQEVRK